MCQFKSGIILKDRVFIPDYDSHDQMLRELGIDDTLENAGTKFIRAELSPTDKDIFSDIEGWVLEVDQDTHPDWFVEEVDKKRMVEAVKEWAKNYILVGKNDFSVSDGKFYLKNCEKVTAHEDSTVKAYGNSEVEAYDNSTVTAYDNSKVEAYDNSEVEAYGNNTVKAYANSTVDAYCNSTVKAYANSKVEAYDNSTVAAYNNSTVKAYDNSEVETCGNSEVGAYNNSTVEAHDNSTVEAHDNSTVEAYSNSTVGAYDNSKVEAYDNSRVTINEFSTNKRENIDLKENATLKDCKTKTIHQSGDWKFVKVGEVNQ
ncbi:hypothetical protein AGMMS49975_28610 [Clostridia bacterium]|nr:hypothetical protein AGMMS49975_28610 [Clostridia bacterium]